jgi:hypothetical protein
VRKVHEGDWEQKYYRAVDQINQLHEKLREVRADRDDVVAAHERVTAEALGRAEAAEAELARQKPVIDAACGWRDGYTQSNREYAMRRVTLINAVDAYRDGGNQ